MFKKRKYFDEFSQTINLIKFQLKSENKTGLTDNNHYLEDFMAEILNMMYDYELINLNKEKKNYPGIDLGDRARKLGIQVTTKSGIEKVKETFEKVKNNEVYKEFSHLQIFVFGDKQKVYRSRFVEMEEGIEFDWKEDIMDCDDIINKFYYLKEARQKEILDYLEKNNQMDSIFNSKKKIAIGVQSFTSSAGDIQDIVDNCLDLREYFHGRFLKEDVSWNKTIVDVINHFLKEQFNYYEKYELILNAHLSICFYLGYCLNSKSGIDVNVRQNTDKGSVLWDYDSTVSNDYDIGTIEKIQNGEGGDSALIINIGESIYDDVACYVNDQHLDIKTIYNFNLNESNSKFFISNGDHAWSVAESIRAAMEKRVMNEKRKILHIFVKGPAAFMFLLGKVSGAFGKIRLYEYRFEDHGGYIPSIKVPLDD